MKINVNQQQGNEEQKQALTHEIKLYLTNQLIIPSCHVHLALNQRLMNKQIAVKMLRELNCSQKKKYIMKHSIYKKLLRGELPETSDNFVTDFLR